MEALLKRIGGEDAAYEAVRWTCVAAMASVVWSWTPPGAVAPHCRSGELGPAETFRFGGRDLAVAWTCRDGTRVLSVGGRHE